MAKNIAETSTKNLFVFLFILNLKICFNQHFTGIMLQFFVCDSMILILIRPKIIKKK